MANPTTNLGMTKPTVGGSTDTWGTTLNEDVIDIVDAVFGSAGTDVSMANVSVDQLTVISQGDLRLADTTGGQYIAFQAHGTTTSYTLTMPAGVPSADDVLTASDGSGTLSWAAPTTGDITAIVAGAGLTGTSLSGPIPTLNVIGTADKITVSADAVTIASGYVGQTSITTVGALNVGSITSGFTSIDVGSGAITTTGTVSGTTLTGTLSTAAQTNITSVGALAAGSIASGFTSISTSYTDAKVESVVAGNVIDVSGATGDVTVSVDLSELSTSTSDGDGDFFAVVDSANAQKKLTKANISIAGFNTAVATSITGTGVVASGTWQGSQLTVAYGGTNLTSYAAGDILYASGSTTLAKLAKGSDTEVLTLASGVPTWAAPTVGDITAVTAGTGMTGGGTTGDVTLNVIGTADKITVSADALTIASTYVGQTSITSVGALAAGSIASGFTSISTSYTDAKVASVVAGTLVDVSGATGDVTVSADLSELSTSTSDGDGDYFAVVDAANAQKKLTKANIDISGFNTAVATSVTGTGALNAGSITSGFGAINVGSSSIDGGTITGTFAGNITGNVTGNASGTAATVTSAAQPTITSVGTLTSVTSSGNLYVSGVGPHSIGGATNPVVRLSLLGAWTSPGTYDAMVGTESTGILTAIAGDTGYLCGQKWWNQIVTQGSSETIAIVAQAYFNEPTITKGSDTVALASTIYVKDAPTEGTISNAIHVASGSTQLQGNLIANSNLNSIGGAVESSVQLNLRGDLDFSGVNGNPSSIQIYTNLRPKAGYNGYGLYIRPTFTEAGSGNHVLLASARFNALSTTGAAATISDTATVYITGASTAEVSGTNYSLWVDAGPVRMDGLPDADPEDAGQLWSNSGVVTVSAG